MTACNISTIKGFSGGLGGFPGGQGGFPGGQGGFQGGQGGFQGGPGGFPGGQGSFPGAGFGGQDFSNFGGGMSQFGQMVRIKYKSRHQIYEKLTNGYIKY